jgi:hypothetical protein
VARASCACFTGGTAGPLCQTAPLPEFPPFIYKWREITKDHTEGEISVADCGCGLRLRIAVADCAFGKNHGSGREREPKVGLDTEPRAIENVWKLRVAAVPPDLRCWPCPTGRCPLIISGLRPRLGRSPRFHQVLPEGHSPSAHRAAKPQTAFSHRSTDLIRLRHVCR